MKTILSIILCFLPLIGLHSQTVKVINKESREALEFVNIKSELQDVLAVTNKNGEADLSVFKDAKKIEFRLIGFKPFSLSYNDLLAQNFIVELSPASVKIDEVVVSATRWNQNSFELPIKIAEIQQLDVKRFNPQTAADLLSVSGKVFIQKSQQGGGSPMIRGFATNRLLYTVDGVRMNTAIFRAGNIQNVISLDPFAIEKTEVLFGPNSVIYGSDAIGGIMAFETLAPKLSLSGNTEINSNSSMRYSSANNERTFHVDLNLGLEKLALILSATTNYFDDLKMGSFGPKDYLRHYYVKRFGNRDSVLVNSDSRVQVPSGYSQYNLMQKLRYVFSDNFDMTFSTHYSTTSNYSRYDRHLRTKKNLPRYGQWDYGPQKWMMNNLFFDYKSVNQLFDEVNLRLAWQKFEESRISRDLNSIEKQIRIEKVDAYSLNVDFIKSLSALDLYYGLEFVYDDVNSIGKDVNIKLGEYNNGPSRYPKSNWGSYAAYLSGKLNLTDNLVLQSGIRFNIYSLNADFDTTFYHFPFKKASITNNALTGNIGFIYFQRNDFSIFTNLSTAFRSPNVDDIGKIFDSEPGSVVVPNPNLKAESAYNVDLGLVKYFGDFIKADVTLFYTYLDNAITRRDFTLNGQDSILYDGTMSKVQALQNAAFARTWGIQTGIEIKFLRNFSFITDINFQKGEEELDDGSFSPSRHAAPLFGVVKLNYSSNKFFANLYLQFSEAKEFDDLPEEEKAKTEIYAKDKNGNPYSPAWYTLNFKCNYQWLENFDIGFGIENITDQRYKPYSSGIAAAGRNFIFSASFRY